MDPRCKGMPLSSFILKPMQRVTRYPLLIKNVSPAPPLQVQGCFLSLQGAGAMGELPTSHRALEADVWDLTGRSC